MSFQKLCKELSRRWGCGSWAESCSWASEPTPKQADSDLGQCHDTESAPYTKRRWGIRILSPFCHTFTRASAWQEESFVCTPTPKCLQTCPDQSIVSTGKKRHNNHSTKDSRVVPHRGTNLAALRLTLQIGRDAVLSESYGRG
jgi:hypothetical protein